MAIKINLLSILGEMFALALENWVPIVVALSAATVLIVPGLMIYLAIHDQLGSRCVQKSRNDRGRSAVGTYESRANPSSIRRRRISRWEK